jgi:hypothetical protein
LSRSDGGVGLQLQSRGYERLPLRRRQLDPLSVVDLRQGARGLVPDLEGRVDHPLVEVGAAGVADGDRAVIGGLRDQAVA